jgi:hypothetical protein
LTVVHRNNESYLFFKVFKTSERFHSGKERFHIAVFVVAFFPTTLIVVETFHCRKKNSLWREVKKEGQKFIPLFCYQNC